jgi:hypothetical protein
MTTTLLTPMERGKARPSGASLWRKQLLPVGRINYKGRVIDFTREYLAGLVKAFTDRAYDAVPLQFADEENRHTEKVEHRRGTVRGLELTDDGLDVIVSAGPQGAAYLAEYPDLGISAKIVEDYERADGKFFPAALKHVLGTLDPRITGMRPWQEIAAANDDGGEVLDLTGEAYAAPGVPGQHDNGGALPPGTVTTLNGTGTPEPVPTPPGPPAPEVKETGMAFTPDQEARLAQLIDLPDDQFTRLLSAAAAPAAGQDGTGGDDDLSDEELAELIDSLGADEDEETGTETGAETGAVPAGAGASLSAEAQAQIDLANSRADENAIELARVTTALDRAAYERERDHYSRQYGIPPRIVDLARPVLEGNGHVIELSNGSTVDAGAIVRKVLAEVGKTVKMLDLSGELGTELDFSAENERADEERAAAERRELIDATRQMTGI